MKARLGDGWRMGRRKPIIGVLVLTTALIAAPNARSVVLSGSGHSAEVDVSVAATGAAKQGKAPVAITASGKLSDDSGAGQLQSADLALDPRLRVMTTGLGRCTPGKVVGKPIATAKKVCGNALVGKGSLVVEYVFSFAPDLPPETATMQVFLFNAGLRGGRPQVVTYIYTTAFGIPAALAFRDPLFSLDVSELGGITRSFQLHVGKAWTYQGERLSYLSGPCPSVLSSKMTLAFSDKTTLTGSVPARCGGSGRARVSSAVTGYPTHATFSVRPNGGGYEGHGQTATVTITSPKAACRQRRFTVDLRSPEGTLDKTYVYRTDASGHWALDTVAPFGPGRAVVTVPPKRLDRTHRCKATSTVVPVEGVEGPLL